MRHAPVLTGQAFVLAIIACCSPASAESRHYSSLGLLPKDCYLRYNGYPRPALLRLANIRGVGLTTFGRQACGAFLIPTEAMFYSARGEGICFRLDAY